MERSCELGLKIAVAVGAARRFVVGDPDIQLIDVLAGRLVDELAATEHLAEEGEVVLDQSALQFLSTRAEISERRRDDEQQPGSSESLGRSPSPSRHAFGGPDRPLPEELVRPWLLAAVYERLRTGRGEFLAELRPAIPCSSGSPASTTTPTMTRSRSSTTSSDARSASSPTAVATCCSSRWETRGRTCTRSFGSPHAHEDDAARACAAALYLLALEGVTGARDLQIGVAHGRLRSGTYGHDMRRTFVCLGDAVNLAARLMSRAPIGEIYVEETAREQAGEAFSWERLPELTVKGKAGPISVHALRGLGEDPGKRRQQIRASHHRTTTGACGPRRRPRGRSSG